MSELRFKDGGAPATPPVGEHKVYAKAGGIFAIDSTGTETPLSSAGVLPVDDATALVKGSSDASKLVRIEADGLTTATTRVLAMANQDVDLTPNTGTYPAALHAARHALGGADVLSVAGLTGLLATAQTPILHSATHKHAGTDEVATVTPSANAIPKADGASKLAVGWIPGHVVTHGDGGTDEINVGGLSGLLADQQTPTVHGNTHQHGESDEIATATPGADLIPKADGTGKLAVGWIPPAAPAAHAASHQHGGADPVAVAAAAANAIPKALGTGLLAQSWLPGLKDFGFVEVTTLATNSTTSPVTYATFNLNNTAASPKRFMLLAFWVFQYDSTSQDSIHQLRVAGLDLIDPDNGGVAQERQYNANSAKRFPRTVVGTKSLAAGLSSFTLQFWGTALIDHTMFHAVLMGFRIEE